ncbi:MAG: heme-binding protein [Lachnospiraceae bacterium]|nr:heme-binding protein [Lachnospiraceae bacterium]
MKEQLIYQAVEQALREAGKSAMTMTLDMAKKLAGQVEQKAKEMGIPVVIAVADKAARPVAIHCMDDAYIASFDIALNKAYTSAGLKMSTARLSELSGPGQPLYGIQNTNNGQIVIFGGGEALEINGRIVGALGVSGGTLEQDTYLAAYGREMFEKSYQNAAKKERDDKQWQ